MGADGDLTHHHQPSHSQPSLLVLALAGLLFIVCTRPGFHWGVTQFPQSYSNPGTPLGGEIGIEYERLNGTHYVGFLYCYHEMAHQLERGLTNKPITVKWLGESTSLPDKKIGAMFPAVNEPEGSHSTFPSFSFNSSNVEGPTKMPMENRDFENLVLDRMRQAEERRKLAQQIKNEEG
uniref:Uncharacterized protein n=1 Tax=Timema genevievae TaxID=629358 RepID=A0A7R9PSM8_TIMGE|nr:unnamed protein product [Timema genevievae]